MPWDAIAAFAVDAIASEQRRHYEQSKADLAPFMGECIEAPVVLKESHKCESCGSRQFLRLNGAKICAYCRSEQ